MNSNEQKAHLQNLLSLEFFALCPNGKRIPVKEFCKEAAGSKQGYVYRSFDDRLVVVLEAVFPAEAIYNGTLSVMVNSTPERLYWRQAFYLSTGESSGMEKTWLPFSGVISRIPTSEPLYRRIIERNKKGRAKISYQQGWSNYEVSGTQPVVSWFSKHEYATPGKSELPYGSPYEIDHRNLTEDEEQKLYALKEIYGRLYLPEGNFLQSGYHPSFSRFGCPSYALASHALGGNLFNRSLYERKRYGAGDYLFYDFSYLTRYKMSTYSFIKSRLNVSSPLQPCFVEFTKKYPIEKPYVINKYIDDMKAIPIMNAFRELNLFPPGLSYVQTPIRSLGYSLPNLEYYAMLTEAVYYLWSGYHIGRVSQQKLEATLRDPFEFERFVKGIYRKTKVLANEKTIDFNMDPRSLKDKPEYYGGKTRRMKRSRTETRKSH